MLVPTGLNVNVYRCLTLQPSTEDAVRVRGMTAAFFHDEYDGKFSRDALIRDITSTTATLIKLTVHRTGTFAETLTADEMSRRTEITWKVSLRCTDRKLFYVDIYIDELYILHSKSVYVYANSRCISTDVVVSKDSTRLIQLSWCKPTTRCS